MVHDCIGHHAGYDGPKVSATVKSHLRYVEVWLSGTLQGVLEGLIAIRIGLRWSARPNSTASLMSAGVRHEHVPITTDTLARHCVFFITYILCEWLDASHDRDRRRRLVADVEHRLADGHDHQEFLCGVIGAPTERSPDL